MLRLDLISAKRKEEGKVARAFSDYEIVAPKAGKVVINGKEEPVELIEKL